jgi:hypothetical protein
MSSYFLRSGNTFRVSSKEALDLHEQLPVGNYVIKKDPMSGQLYLETIDSFEIKGKLYGNTTRHAGRILNTFKDRSASTGVMLTGEKGSGKTLLTKRVCIDAASEGIPTIVINAPWCGDQFNAFMQTINQPCIVLFDEFEKVYDKESQQHILTLLDGVFPSKKLFLLTCNDKWRVDAHMRNRPGRIFYMLDFKGLDQEFIREYCEDNLNAKTHTDSICRIATMFDQFNFDMLKAMIEDMNRYGETPQEVLAMLNAKPEFSGESTFKVSLQVDGVDIDDKYLSSEWEGQPLTRDISIDWKKVTGVDEQGSDDYEWQESEFTPDDLKQIDAPSGKFVFMNEDGDRLVLTKKKDKPYNYYAF